MNSPKKKKKKARTTFTGKQIFELEKKFEDKKYLSSTERAEMATLLTVTETQVKIWYVQRASSLGEDGETFLVKRMTDENRIKRKTTSLLALIMTD